MGAPSSIATSISEKRYDAVSTDGSIHCDCGLCCHKDHLQGDFEEASGTKENFRAQVNFECWLVRRKKLVIPLLVALVVGIGVAKVISDEVGKKERKTKSSIVRGKTFENTTIFLGDKKSYKGCLFKNVNFKL